MNTVLGKVLAFVGRSPAGPMLRPLARRLGIGTPPQGVSYGHQAISSSGVTPDLVDGWKEPDISKQQRLLVDSQLKQMYAGDVVAPFRVAVEALRATGMTHGSIVEVGCASGYYHEALSHLLGQGVDYLGLDYSPAMISLGLRSYPNVPFVVGDATQLPLKEEACDILLSGTVLLHVPDYEATIRESARVARHWCIFHRTPVFRETPTTFFSKYAYGVKVVELVFNEKELFTLFQKYGLILMDELLLESYPLEGISEEVGMKTYVCRKSTA